jgi:hypothetical protein
MERQIRTSASLCHLEIAYFGWAPLPEQVTHSEILIASEQKRNKRVKLPRKVSSAKTPIASRDARHARGGVLHRRHLCEQKGSSKLGCVDHCVSVRPEASFDAAAFTRR